MPTDSANPEPTGSPNPDGLGFNQLGAADPTNTDGDQFAAQNDMEPGPAFELGSNAPGNNAPPDGFEFPVELTIGASETPGAATTGFVAAVTVKLPFRSQSRGNPVLFYRVSPHNWKPVVRQKLVGNKIQAVLTSLGYYKVFSPILNASYSFGETYVFPNPTSPNQATLHVEVAKSNEISTRIYDPAGDIVYETRVDSQIKVVNGKPCYEIPLDLTQFKPGVYVGVVTAKKDGKETIRKRYRFTVLR